MLSTVLVAHLSVIPSELPTIFQPPNEGAVGNHDLTARTSGKKFCLLKVLLVRLFSVSLLILP